MIKTNKINNEKVDPYWAKGEDKPVRKEHALITEEPYLNIIACAPVKSGKTTALFHLILRNFMTKDTKLVIFSPSIGGDEKNSNAIEAIRSKFNPKPKKSKDNTKVNSRNNWDRVILHRKFVDGEGEENMLLKELDEAQDQHKGYSEDNPHPYSYPQTIMWFDDLGDDEFKSHEIAGLSQTFRHSGILPLYSSQDWKNFHPKTRNNAGIVLLWKGIPVERLKDIFFDVQPNVTWKDFIKLYNHATRENKSFLYIDKINKKMRRNLDEELFIKSV